MCASVDGVDLTYRSVALVVDLAATAELLCRKYAHSPLHFCMETQTGGFLNKNITICCDYAYASVMQAHSSGAGDDQELASTLSMSDA